MKSLMLSVKRVRNKRFSVQRVCGGYTSTGQLFYRQMDKEIMTLNKTSQKIQTVNMEV